MEATGSLLAWQGIVFNAAVRGTVARLAVDLGDARDRAARSAPVFTIVQTDLLKFTGTVPEHAVRQVEPGPLVRLRAELAEAP